MWNLYNKYANWIKAKEFVEKTYVLLVWELNFVYNFFKEEWIGYGQVVVQIRGPPLITINEIEFGPMA
jgi:hypothetical protein